LEENDALAERVEVAFSSARNVSAALLAVIDHIDADPMRRPDLETLAQLSGYSKRQLLRHFRDATGSSPHRYILNRRLEAARALILGSTDRLTEIAFRCGFSSDSHMAYAFRKRFGESPSGVRKKKSESTVSDETRRKIQQAL
jgi:AraC family transcriptional regulator